MKLILFDQRVAMRAEVPQRQASLFPGRALKDADTLKLSGGSQLEIGFIS